jgi:hypothetical protein
MRYAMGCGIPPFAVFWLIGITIVAWAGGQVDGYVLHVMNVPLPHPYPWRGVATMAGIQSIEVLLVYAVMRPWAHPLSWKRVRAAFLLSLALLLSFGVTLMHAPPFMVWHWIWLAGGSVALLVLLCVERTRRSGIQASDAQLSS